MVKTMKPVKTLSKQRRQPLNDGNLSIIMSGLQDKNPDLHNLYVKKNYVFEYIIDGKGYISIDGKKFTVKTGDLILFPIDKLIEFHADKKDPFSYYWVDFFGHSSGLIMEQAGFANNNYVISYNDDIILNLMKNICISNKYSNIINNLETLSYMFQLLAYLIKKNSNPTSPLTTSDDYINKAIWFIANYFNEDIKLEDIAKHVGISKFYLSNLFSNNMGTSLVDYLIKYRIEQSQNLLLATNMPISNIAYACGFNSLSYFTLMFRKYVGFTPKEYRKNKFIPI